MGIQIQFDLFTVGLTMAATIFLGFVVFFNQQKSITHRVFLLFSISVSIWGALNYASYSIQTAAVAFWALRLVLFFAVWQAFFLFLFFYLFPKSKKRFPRWLKYGLIPLVVIMSLSTLTPLILKKISQVSITGRIEQVTNGPLMPLFGMMSIGFIIGSLYILLRDIFKSEHEKERKALLTILVGTIITFTLIICFNFVFPVLFGNAQFIPFATLFFFPFILFTSYALIWQRILNIKVLSTEILVFILTIAILFEVITSETIAQTIYSSSLFLLVISVGIILVRNVRAEVAQRQELGRLAKRLKHANSKLKELDTLKTEFLSIATHQLRTPLSIIKGYISLLDEGAYGNVTKAQHEIYHNIDVSNERLVKLVDEFLNISRIEQGRTKYSFEPMQMKDVIDSVVGELQEKAGPKRIELNTHVKKVSQMVGDADRLRHCVFNFVDNAIKYNDPESTINIYLEPHKKGVQVRVVDHGPGLDAKDIKNLFQKFYRSPHVSRDFEGNGLGIFVVKEFVEAHGGEVWAKSDGIGKGSEFGFYVPKKPKKRRKKK